MEETNKNSRIKWEPLSYPNSGLYKNVDEQGEVDYFVIDLENGCVLTISRSCAEAIIAQGKKVNILRY